MRTAKELLVVSKEFASEIRWLSWWHLWTTLTALVLTVAVAVNGDFPNSLRVFASIIAGLVGVRLFIIYHDYQHSAILGNSTIADCLMTVSGLLMLNPPSAWNRSHDHHHKNNSKTFGASIGSFPIMTTQAYANASESERFNYAATRHPLTIALGYFTVFVWGMCLRPFLQDPRRHWDGALSLSLNAGLMIGCAAIGGFNTMFLGIAVPMFVATTVGAYLFYAQHNFPTAQIVPRSEWSHVDAALHSSSFIMMSPLMHWFTGNIGYHHVHHLNARIPFYRLPSAMAALEELQSPGTTTLHPRDVMACLRLKLWSAERNQFVNFERAFDSPTPPISVKTPIRPHAVATSEHYEIA